MNFYQNCDRMSVDGDDGEQKKMKRTEKNVTVEQGGYVQNMRAGEEVEDSESGTSLTENQHWNGSGSSFHTNDEYTPMFYYPIFHSPCFPPCCSDQQQPVTQQNIFEDNSAFNVEYKS